MNKDRLLKLADHLENGQLGHKVFDFSVYNVNVDEEGGSYSPSEYSCGTNGCAIGECPIVWPEAWHFNMRGWPVLSELLLPDPSFSAGLEYRSAMQWFDITEGEAKQLFTPHIFIREGVAYGIEKLPENATKGRVAENIRKFVAWKETQS